MKIGILTERMLSGFGVDLVVHNQAMGLIGEGHDVTIFAINVDETYKEYPYKIVEIPVKINKHNPFTSELSAISQRKFLNKQGIHTWIIHTWPLFALTPFLKGNVFITDHGTVSPEGMYLKLRLAFWYQKFITPLLYFPFAKNIISISKYIQSQIPFFLRPKSKIVYNGTDHYTKDYHKNKQLLNTLKKELGLKKDAVTMLFVGRLNPEYQPYKGVNDLLEIFKQAKQRNPKLELIMTGYGSEHDAERLRKKGAKVIPNSDNETLLALFDLCDFYVAATKWEGFNLPMIEAQSFGKIPVVYDIGPHAEILNSGVDSFVVSTQAEFVDRVLYLSHHEAFREENAINAKKNARKYTWEKSIEKLHAVITQKV